MTLNRIETLCNSWRYANTENIERLTQLSIARYSIADWSRVPKKHSPWKFMIYADDIQNEIRNELKET